MTPQELQIEETMASVKTIQREVAKFYKIDVDALISQSRCRKYAWPRQNAMFLCREMVTVNGHPISFPSIGNWFGGRDHTTVLWAIKRVRERYEECPRTESDIQELRKIIEAAGDWKPRIASERAVAESLAGAIAYAEDAR
jgi:chromosomal replication initiator protein